MNSKLIFLAQTITAETPSGRDQAIGIAVLLVAAILSYFILRIIILPLVRGWVTRSKNRFDDMLLDPQLLAGGRAHDLLWVAGRCRSWLPLVQLPPGGDLYGRCGCAL